MEPAESIRMKLYFEKPPEFTVTFTNKEDLYQSFKDHVDKWTTKQATTYWVDDHGAKVTIDDADALLSIATKGNGTVNVTVRDEGVEEESCPEYGEEIEKRRRRKGHKIDRGRNQEGSRGRDHRRCRRGHGRSHSRDSSDHEGFQEFCEHYAPYYGPPPFFGPPHGRPPMFCPCNPFHFPMNARFGGYPFFGMERGRCGHPVDGWQGNFHGY
ncbi:unnamed protein product [Angiostrongylus costaricensis]|uniref:PB1 domain-containing protein n=1 Tax=Angiostrongylus costaricensis TaxID=334426 RepID=A0A0R3PK02_ANGCS|nr:unnamed protein product [Angiostrongylus costaricensis]